MKYLISISFLIGLAVTFTNCGKDEPGTTNNAITIEEFIDRNNISPNYTTSGVGYVISNPGDDRRITDTSTLKVIVVVRSTDNRLLLDTEGEVYINMVNQVTAMREGLALVGDGGQVTLYAPFEQGWGETGNGSIPGNTDVIIEITVVNILRYIDEYINDNNIMITDTTASGVRVLIEEEGDGSFPDINNVVEVIYKGYLTNGEVFDEQELGLSISLSNVIVGWREGIPKFSKGGKGKLFIPYQVAYGNNGNASIPPRTDLIFDIELVNFN